MDFCAAAPSSGQVGSVVRYLDCQAQALGTGAWQALAMPGSTLAIVLTGFLTLFVAVIGYRLLLGHDFTIRDGVLAMVKVGAVLALATSWPAYKTLIYDLATSAPLELAAEIGPRSGATGADGSLLARLDGADQQLASLAILGPGAPAFVMQGPQAGSNAAVVAPSPFAGFSAFALGGARILFMVTAIASLGVVRLVAGLLLAVGPFFIAFLLFDNTRSLFEGFLRVLAGAALATLGATLILSLQLAFLEPWLGSALARRQAGEALPSLPTELFVLTLVFTIILVAAVLASARIARAFRLAPWLPPHSPAADTQTSHTSSRAQQQQVLERSESSRTTTLVRQLTASDAREAALRVVSGTNRAEWPGQAAAEATGAPVGGRAPVLGQSFRRSQPRLTRSADRRDSR